MKLIHHPSKIHQHSKRAITIGNFDGVHAGHAQIVTSLVKQAQRRNLVPTVITFAPNPKQYIAKRQSLPIPTQIQPLRDKTHHLKALGITELVILPFNTKTIQTQAEDFIKQTLVEALNCQYLMIGDDFRFGAQRRGNYELLAQMADQYGYKLEQTPSILMDEIRVSSSAIRESIQNGRLTEARSYLGHHLTLTGRVVYGQQLGRTIEVPTINLIMPEYLATQGVFSARVQLTDQHGTGSEWIDGVASIGFRPTVDHNGQCWCEVHLFDFNQNVYGQMARVVLVNKIRDELKFDSLEALLPAIQQDIQMAKQQLQEASADEWQTMLFNCP